MNTRGFTLIELMVVVIIIGILAATAIPLYRAYIEHAATTEAKANIADIASREERFHALHKYYIQTEPYKPPLPVANTRSPQDSNDRWQMIFYPAQGTNGGLFGGPLYFRYHVDGTGYVYRYSISDYTICARRNLDDGGVQVLGLRSDNRGAFLDNIPMCNN